MTRMQKKRKADISAKRQAAARSRWNPLTLDQRRAALKGAVDGRKAAAAARKVRRAEVGEDGRKTAGLAGLGSPVDALEGDKRMDGKGRTVDAVDGRETGIGAAL